MGREIYSLEIYMPDWHQLKFFGRTVKHNGDPDMKAVYEAHNENWKDFYSHFQPVDEIVFSSVDELNTYLEKNGYPKYFNSLWTNPPVGTIKHEFKLFKTPRYPVMLVHAIIQVRTDETESMIFCFLPYTPR